MKYELTEEDKQTELDDTRKRWVKLQSELDNAEVSIMELKAKVKILRDCPPRDTYAINPHAEFTELDRRLAVQSSELLAAEKTADAYTTRIAELESALAAHMTEAKANADAMVIARNERNELERRLQEAKADRPHAELEAKVIEAVVVWRSQWKSAQFDTALTTNLILALDLLQDARAPKTRTEWLWVLLNQYNAVDEIKWTSYEDLANRPETWKKTNISREVTS